MAHKHKDFFSWQQQHRKETFYGTFFSKRTSCNAIQSRKRKFFWKKVATSGAFFSQVHKGIFLRSSFSLDFHQKMPLFVPLTLSLTLLCTFILIFLCTNFLHFLFEKSRETLKIARRHFYIQFQKLLEK